MEIDRLILLYLQCSELDSCDGFNWLGETEALKEKLLVNKGKDKLEIALEALEQAP